MNAATGRNWNQIIIWAVVAIVVLALIVWWAGVFDQEVASTTEPAPQATTTTEQSGTAPTQSEEPAKTEQSAPAEEPAGSTQSQ